MLTDNPAAPLILIVEDDDSHTELIRRSFESSPEEYRLHVARVLHDARQDMDKHPPSLVLTDYRLPDGDGGDLVKMVNETCPVVMMTSQGNEQVAVDAMKAGVLDYVVKSGEAFSAMPRIAQRALREWALIQERKRMEEALAAREQEFRAMIENAPDPIIRYDRDGRRIYVNPATERISGKEAGSLLGNTPREAMLVASMEGDRIVAWIRQVVETGKPTEGEVEYVAPNGAVHYFHNRYVPEWGKDGEVASVLSISRDITARRMAEELLHRREESLRALVENAPDPIVRYDRDARLIYVNPAFERLAGKPASQLLGKTPAEMPVGRETVGAITHQAILRVLAEGVPVEVEVFRDEGPGTPRSFQINFVPEFDRDGMVMSVQSIARDISLIRNYQQQLHKLAYFDTLTELPNRALFNDRLHQAIAEAARHEQNLGLMLLDLDRFKTVNDSLGHSAGDRLLCDVGRRIRASIREYDTVARLGGDEFAVILPEVRQGEDMGTIARKILATFAEPFVIDGQELFVTASIGITFYPLDNLEIGALIQCADVAMYYAKSMGRNNFQFYSADLTAHAAERHALESGLRQALKHGELEIYYQPKVKVSSGELLGAEALLRWNHPERGLVPPLAFIGIAEDTGLIVEIGAWVLRGACRVAHEWNSTADRNLKIAVNMSVRQFADADLAGTVRGILEETGCRPEWLELEITESLLLNDCIETRSVLEEFRRMGISIAIDDFGTGYSALLYLTRFPIDTIKIDRSFIRDITTNPDSAELVHAIVSLAGSLRMTLVAEGVETAEQAAYLNDIGCQMAQGYFYGKPMPVGQFETQLGISKRQGNCLAQIQGIAGSTILGDGLVALIADPAGMIDERPASL